jgi:hypothetical protein
VKRVETNHAMTAGRHGHITPCYALAAFSAGRLLDDLPAVRQAPQLDKEMGGIRGETRPSPEHKHGLTFCDTHADTHALFRALFSHQARASSYFYFDASALDVQAEMGLLAPAVAKVPNGPQRFSVIAVNCLPAWP